MVGKWFRRVFLKFFHNSTKILIAFLFMRQVLHREPASFEGFQLVDGFSRASVKKFDCVSFAFER